MTSRILVTAAAAALLALASGPGCNPDVPTATPDGAWRAFRRAADRGNNAAAFRLISKADQDALAARAKDAGGGLEAADMLRVDRRSLPPWRDMTVSIEGERATVTITLDDEAQEGREAVLEAGGWRVVLGVSPP